MQSFVFDLRTLILRPLKGKLVTAFRVTSVIYNVHLEYKQKNSLKCLSKGCRLTTKALSLRSLDW